MTKRYREQLDHVTVAAGRAAGGRAGDGRAPVAFEWRGRAYRVSRVLGHWREDPGWWRRPDGTPVRIEQADLWRVEARDGAPAQGVYELVHRAGAWTLERVWD